MKAIVYRSTGGPDVLELVERPLPAPGPGEVRVRVRVSGVNPTDWKARRGSRGAGGAEQVPNQDGAGVVDALGEGVDAAWAGRRVWIWQAAWQRADGTAQEYVVLPLRQAVPLLCRDLGDPRQFRPRPVGRRAVLAVTQDVGPGRRCMSGGLGGRDQPTQIAGHSGDRHLGTGVLGRASLHPG